MKLQLLRNASLKMTYGGHTLLIDPYLAPRGSLPAYAGRHPNPLVDLPLSPEEIVAGVDAVLVSHLHTDHFDAAAQAQLPREIPLFCQPGDEDRIRETGFRRVKPVAGVATWQGLEIQRTPGRHGTSAGVLGQMGQVSGFFMTAPGEPALYWAGDTVWYEDVERVIAERRPEVVVTHSGGAVWAGEELIIMDADQTVAVCQAAGTTVIATHLEALDHCLTSRAELRRAARAAGIPDSLLLIPADGETIIIETSQPV